jgi:hypothetical protein
MGLADRAAEAPTVQRGGGRRGKGDGQDDLGFARQGPAMEAPHLAGRMNAALKKAKPAV